MRRHHEKAHVVDDVLRREKRSVFIARPTKLREDILPAGLASAWDFAREKLDDAFSTLHPPIHLRARDGLPDGRDRRRDHRTKVTVHLFRMELRMVADVRGRREIERQLLDRRIEQKRSSALHPVRDALGDAEVQLLEIGFHRARLEGDRQRLTVQSMLIEIEQHQSARKNPLEDRAPAH